MKDKKKKLKQRIQNARERSHTVFATKQHVVYDEFATFEGPTIYLDRENFDALPYAVCSGGDFKTEPDSNLLALGRAAREHADESGHKLRGIS